MPQINKFGLEATFTANGTDFNTYDLSITDETDSVPLTNSSDYNSTTKRTYSRVGPTTTTFAFECSFFYDVNNLDDVALASGIEVPIVITKSRTPLKTAVGTAFIKSRGWKSGGRDGYQEVTISGQYQGQAVFN